VEIVGEIAKMVELGIGNIAKRATLDEMMTRSVKVVAGARNQRYMSAVVNLTEPYILTVPDTPKLSRKAWKLMATARPSTAISGVIH
jgi:hypothetical protein